MDLESSTIIITAYCYSSVSLMQTAILIAKNGLIEECDKDESVEVTWDATTSRLKIQ